MSSGTETTGFPRPYGKYELLDLIGEGGMAEVFKARLHGVAGFEKIVVIKRILPHLARNPQFVQMFVNEAKLAAMIQHRNVVQVFELGEENNNLYIAMEYVPGLDLRRMLRLASERGFRMPIWFTLKLMAEVLSGLAYAHELLDAEGRSLPVVHRDVTPANVFVSFQGEVKLADFGIAKAIGNSPDTQAGQVKGSVAYMSPEALLGHALDARTDVFSVGVVLWEFLTQRACFAGRSNFETARAICEGAREPPSRYNPRVPAALDQIAVEALDADKDRRIRSARELQARIVEILSHMRPRRADIRDVVEVLLGRKAPDAELLQDLVWEAPVAAVPSSIPSSIPGQVGGTPPQMTVDPMLGVPVAPISSGPVPIAPGIAPNQIGQMPGQVPVQGQVPIAPGQVPVAPALWNPPPIPPQNVPPQMQGPPPLGPVPQSVSWSALAPTQPKGYSGIKMVSGEPIKVAQGSAVPPGPPQQQPQNRGQLTGEDIDVIPLASLHEFMMSVGNAPEPKPPMAQAAQEMTPPGIDTGPPVTDGFYLRYSDGRVVGPARYEEMLKLADSTTVALSTDRRNWTDISTFAQLSGLDFLAHRAPPVGKLELVGRLEERSLVSVLAQLAKKRATGRLVILDTGIDKVPARRELDIVNGAPTFVYTNHPNLQLPALLVQHNMCTKDQVAELVHQVLAKKESVLDLVSFRAFTDINRYWPLLMKDRLAEIFRWRYGKFAFDAGARLRSNTPFARGLMPLLFDAVHRGYELNELQRELDKVMNAKLKVADGFETMLRELSLNEKQADVAKRLNSRRTLAALLKKYPSESQAQLAMAFLLMEMEILSEARD